MVNVTDSWASSTRRRARTPGTATFTDANCGKPAVFAETTVTNAGKADVNGIEVTWQQMLLWGFGMQINGTYVHTNGNFNNFSLDVEPVRGDRPR